MSLWTTRLQPTGHVMHMTENSDHDETTIACLDVLVIMISRLSISAYKSYRHCVNLLLWPTSLGLTSTDEIVHLLRTFWDDLVMFPVETISRVLVNSFGHTP
ncbi:uncharacterized protein LOC111087846 isoform X2 [Limulus polyphemus]|uniref:Uncharacterized protein LOC111087846 isoform X2 n=1 Tax=Limulus polyphemus TaxID=6850 RepID=A0ABM1T745_LIMPO|nr:uncharacterized protein LOC111087846 isoform X2 [Limulus polyphemus]